MAKKKPSYGSKTDFILSLPKNMPVTEVVEAAAEAGISVTKTMVYMARKTRSADRPERKLDKEALFCRAAVSVGLERAGQLLTRLRADAADNKNLKKIYGVLPEDGVTVPKKREPRRNRTVAIAPIAVFESMQWILPALDAALADAAAKADYQGATLGIGTIARRALIESIDARFKLLPVHEDERVVGKIPTFMVSTEVESAYLAKAENRRGGKTDYIRSAIAHWLKRNGYAPK